MIQSTFSFFVASIRLGDIRNSSDSEGATPAERAEGVGLKYSSEVTGSR